jgi:uncharacterized membrane protein YoaK (UPF0700 family)
MPIAYARRLVGHDRTRHGNRQLGVLLAFVAGATNAGAFLAVGVYTSHMTGLLSSMADHLVLRQTSIVLAAAGGLLCFTLGAALAAVLVNYARRRGLRSLYAIPLLIEAGLLLLFGLLGASLSAISGLFMPVTVMLLCLAMGLQNALISKVSHAEIRTTHVTGLVTDIGIEIGRALYWNRLRPEVAPPVTANRDRLLTLVALVSSFFAGGVLGAIGFSQLGYAMTLLLALLLLVPAVVPAIDDLRDYARRTDD